MDLLDVIAKRLKEGGFDNVFASAPDGLKNPESISFDFGVTDRKVIYFDGTEASPLRVTVFVKRISEWDAMNDSREAERIIRTSSLESENGSYKLDTVETTDPQPIPWDESGRYVWTFDIYIKTRKDLFS